MPLVSSSDETHDAEAKVSVCVLAFNSAKYIRECLDSLFMQTLEDIEYIIIDDASTDNTYAIITEKAGECAKNLSNVKIFRHEQNMGVAYTRLEALSKATGKYVIFCDSDDYVEQDIYERLYLLAESMNYDMVDCERDRFNDIGGKKLYNKHKSLFPESFIGDLLIGKMHGSLVNKLILRSIIQKSDIDCPSTISVCEDLRILVQIMQKIKTIGYTELPLYHYRENHSSLTQDGYCNQTGMNSRISNVVFFEKILPADKYGSHITTMKQRILLESIFSGGIPLKTWHQLWKREKYTFWNNSNFSLLLKIYYYCGCISPRLARIMKSMIAGAKGVVQF